MASVQLLYTGAQGQITDLIQAVDDQKQAVGDQKKLVIDGDKACEAQKSELRDQVRKAKSKWLVIGTILGYVLKAGKIV